MVNIAFSWDDGAIEDLKMMDLSLRHGIPGIFFIPVKNEERSVLDGENIKLLARNNFEIGAHTYSHSYLTTLPLKNANDELLNGKLFLEQLLGQDIPHFCFPGGKFNSELLTMSKKYFKSARTADTGAIVFNNSYLIKPSFHYFDRGKKSLLYNSLKNNSPIFKMTIKNILCPDYFEIIKKLLMELADNPRLFKVIIWGHSWEIEHYKLWKKLEDLFRSINDYFPGDTHTYSDLINYIEG
jgi:peptidoglycan/xylan/chitin deacetylase (PgdA/CDA1 family)